MNLIDCYVTKVLGKPYYMHEHWWIDVEYDSYGITGETILMGDSKESLEGIEIGHEFLS